MIANMFRSDLYQELKGEPEGKFDTGTISLIIAVGVACFLTFIITCCVCAFRCCGNLKPANGGEHDRKCRRGKGNLLRMQVVRRGSQLRRSFSRSPKFPTREVMSNGGFYMDGQTTMV
ncbi:hypothetical protein AB6A40_009253 [Gnathostoma spinigerum]|uniref:Uncharacterized protein n=1 Tax=Gnathostoma spinigerum TaxID=75299 RepID=A0ABD6ERF2_9BILA